MANIDIIINLKGHNHIFNFLIAKLRQKRDENFEQRASQTGPQLFQPLSDRAPQLWGPSAVQPSHTAGPRRRPRSAALVAWQPSSVHDGILLDTKHTAPEALWGFQRYQAVN